MFDSFSPLWRLIGRCSHFAFVSACQVKDRGKPSKGTQQRNRPIKSSHDIIQQNIGHIETLLLLEMAHRAAAAICNHYRHQVSTILGDGIFATEQQLKEKYFNGAVFVNSIRSIEKCQTVLSWFFFFFLCCWITRKPGLRRCWMLPDSTDVSVCCDAARKIRRIRRSNFV